MLSGAKSREQSDSGNGRLYDSKLARFLSPDPVIQDPSNTQNYNRYSYCLNNPFRYYDPSGYEYDDYDDSYWGDEDEIPPGGRDFGKVFGPIKVPRTENINKLDNIVYDHIDVQNEAHIIEKLAINDYYDRAIHQNGGYSDVDDNRDDDYTYGIDFDVENNIDRNNDDYINKNLSEMKYLGQGLSISGGLGLLDHGIGLQIGFIGTPGTIGRFYITYANSHDTPLFLDCSFSARYNICVSKNPTFKNINGNGFDLSGGYRAIGFDIATDNIKEPSYIMYGFGPSFGPEKLKASGGVTTTKTWSIPFYIGIMITPVGGKF